MLPNNKTQILLFSLLIFLIIVLLGFNFALSRYGAFWQKKEPPSPLVAQPPSFSSPVEKTYLDQVKLIQLDFGQYDLGFSLPEGSPIYAGFEGSITITGDDSQRVIILDSSDAQSRLIYIFSGLAEASDMEKVSQGEVLGRVGKNPLPTREINLIVSYFRNGEKVSLDQEVIKAVKNLP